MAKNLRRLDEKQKRVIIELMQGYANTEGHVPFDRVHIANEAQEILKVGVCPDTVSRLAGVYDLTLKRKEDRRKGSTIKGSTNDRIATLEKQHALFTEMVNDFLIDEYGAKWIDFRGDYIRNRKDEIEDDLFEEFEGFDEPEASKVD